MGFAERDLTGNVILVWMIVGVFVFLALNSHIMIGRPGDGNDDKRGCGWPLVMLAVAAIVIEILYPK